MRKKKHKKSAIGQIVFQDTFSSFKDNVMKTIMLGFYFLYQLFWWCKKIRVTKT